MLGIPGGKRFGIASAKEDAAYSGYSGHVDSFLRAKGDGHMRDRKRINDDDGCNKQPYCAALRRFETKITVYRQNPDGNANDSVKTNHSAQSCRR
jgi:hypothetical protein